MDSNDEYYIAESLVEYSEDEGIGDILTIKHILEIHNFATLNKITPPMPIQEYVNKATVAAIRNIDENTKQGIHKIGYIQPWLGTRGRNNKNTIQRTYFPDHSIEDLKDHIMFAYTCDFEKTGNKNQSIRNILPEFKDKATLPDNPDGIDQTETIKTLIHGIVNSYAQ